MYPWDIPFYTSKLVAIRGNTNGDDVQIRAREYFGIDVVLEVWFMSVLCISWVFLFKYLI